MPYIDRDKLIKELSTMYKQPTSTEDFMTIGYDHAIADMVVTVYGQPTADVVERKRGKWHDVGSLSCRCSECGCKSEKESSFCPNCGAEM